MPDNALAIHQLATMTQPETHRAPASPFTVDRAHGVMQFHIACRAKKCPRKAAALRTLAEAGRVVPPTSKPR